MRQEISVPLDDDRSVTLRELRVRDVRRILARLSPEKLQCPIPELLQTHLPELFSLLDDALVLPDGMTLDELGLSECETIATAWWEMHKRFFAPVAAMVQETLRQRGGRANSPGPASSSSSAGTGTCGTTAGASS